MNPGPDEGEVSSRSRVVHVRERPATHTRTPDANLQGKKLYNGDVATGTHPMLFNTLLNSCKYETTVNRTRSVVLFFVRVRKCGTEEVIGVRS